MDRALATPVLAISHEKGKLVELRVKKFLEEAALAQTRRASYTGGGGGGG